MSRSFCTDLAVTRGEPQEGTGVLAERHLFLAWPKGKWRRPRFQSAEMIPALQQAMQAATGKGRYVGLVDAGDASDLRLWSFPDGRSVVPRDQAEAAELIAAWGEGTPLAGAALQRPVILCCTDAKTDACCARFGFPIYKALMADADRFGFDVLQCTHIGGCHFAPSIIVMPQRHRYGRLTPAQIPDLLATLARGEIYLPAFKGRPELDEAEQVAEIAGMRWAAAHGVATDQVRILATTELAEDARTIQLDVAGEALSITLQRRVFEVHGNCRTIDEGPGKLVPRWTLRA